jgi:hypothetical protein
MQTECCLATGPPRLFIARFDYASPMQVRKWGTDREVEGKSICRCNMLEGYCTRRSDRFVVEVVFITVVGVKLWGSGTLFQIVKLCCSAEVTRFPSRERSLVVKSHAESRLPNQNKARFTWTL